MIIRFLSDHILGGTPEDFIADGSPVEAAQRLAKSTRRRSLFAAVVGRVSVERVALHRHRFFLNHGFASVYRGRFIVESGRTVLRGRFQFHPLAQVFMVLWFGFLGAICVAGPFVGVIGAIERGEPIWPGLLFGIAFSLFGLLLGFLAFGMIRLFRRLLGDDVPEIRRHIATSLARKT